MKNIVLLLFICFTIRSFAQSNYDYGWVVDSGYICYKDSATKQKSGFQTIQERKVIVRNNKAYRMIYHNGEFELSDHAWVKSDTGIFLKELPIAQSYSIFPDVPKCWDFKDDSIFTIRCFLWEFDRRFGLVGFGGPFDKILVNPNCRLDQCQTFIVGLPPSNFLRDKYSRPFSDINGLNGAGRPYHKTVAQVRAEIRETVFFDILVAENQRQYYFGIEQDTLKVWEFDEKRVLKDFEDEWKLLHAYKLPLKGYFSAIQKNNTFYIISNEGHIFKLGKKAKKIGTIGRKLSEVVLIDDKDNETLGWLPKIHCQTLTNIV